MSLCLHSYFCACVFFICYGAPRDLHVLTHSFPTRRSSDLCSHALGETDPKDFWGVTKDAESVAEFIRLWLNDNGRWNSPKYLGGESYGTTRSAAVVNQLTGAYNDVALNGVILISTVLDFGAGADTDRQSTRLNSSPYCASRIPSS